MAVGLVTHTDLGLGHDSLVQPEAVQLATGRVLFYGYSDTTAMGGLLVDLDVSGMSLALSATYVDQVISLGNSGTTDYIGLLRSGWNGHIDFTVELVSIDAAGTMVSLDSLLVSSETNASSEWGPSMGADEALLIWTWSGAGNGLAAVLTRTGTSLSLGTPFDHNKTWYGSFFDSSHSGSALVWIDDESAFPPPVFSRLDTSTMLIDAVPTPPAGWQFYYNMSQGPSANPVAEMHLTADFDTHSLARYTPSSVTLIGDTWSNSATQLERVVVDVNDVAYWLEDAFTADIIFHYVNATDDTVSVNVEVETYFPDERNIVAFGTGILVLGVGDDIDGGPADLWYYSSDAPDPPPPPSNDEPAGAINLFFSPDDVIEVRGTLAWATGLDEHGLVTEAEWSNVWYKLDIPPGHHGIFGAQLDREAGAVAGDEPLEYTYFNQYHATGELLQYFGDTGTSHALFDDHPADIMTVVGDIIRSANDIDQAFISGGDTLYIAVSHAVDGSNLDDTEFILRYAYYELATSTPDMPSVSSPGAMIHTFIMQELWEGDFWGVTRGSIGQVDEEGNVVFRSFWGGDDPDGLWDGGWRPGKPNESIDVNQLMIGGTGTAYGGGSVGNGFGPINQGRPRLVSVPEDTEHVIIKVSGSQIASISTVSSGIEKLELIDITTDTVLKTLTLPEYEGEEWGAVSGSKIAHIFYTSTGGYGYGLRVIDLDTESYTLINLVEPTAGYGYRMIGTRDDGKVVIYMQQGFLSFPNNAPIITSGLVIDPVTEAVSSITFSGAPSAPVGMPDSHKQVWGFRSTTNIGHYRGITYDGVSLVNSWFYPSTNWGTANDFTWWGDEFVESVYRTNLTTGVTRHWFDFESPWTDITNGDSDTQDNIDKRSINFSEGAPGAGCGVLRMKRNRGWYTVGCCCGR